MKGYQPQLFQLRSPTVAAGQSDTVTLDTLPGLMLDGIAHVLGFLFRARITPTFTTAPTVYGVNNLVARLTVNNGMNVMFDGSFNSLRFHEILENGGTPLLPDPDTNSGTGNGFYFERVMWLGPNRYAGAPSDFAMPCAAMRNGSIQFNFGSVTQISADTSAYTSSIEVYAILAPIYGEVRVPALWERNSYSFGAAEYSIQGRAKYGNVAIQAGSLTTVTTLAAGNLVALTIDTGKGHCRLCRHKRCRRCATSPRLQSERFRSVALASRQQRPMTIRSRSTLALQRHFRRRMRDSAGCNVPGRPVHHQALH